jgi:hypothetical protein
MLAPSTPADPPAAPAAAQASPTLPPPASLPPAYEPFTAPPAGPPLVSRFGRPGVLIPVVILAAVVLVGLGLLLFGGDLFAPTVKTFATRDAEVMSAIDPAKATSLGSVHRGDALSGHWIKGRDGKPQWLKIAWPGHDGGFVWGRDLSTRQRPDLTPSGALAGPATSAALVYAEPDKTSPIVDDLAPGESASAVGDTSDGWTELSLATGGVGYVQTTAFQPGGGDAAVSATLANLRRFRCTFAPGQSVNAAADTRALDFYFDENRLCINHTYAYLRDQTGALRRVMLNDKARRVSLLQFSADRQAFSRTDYDLSPDAYATLSHTSAALKSIVCPPPRDPDALATVHATLASATPDLDAQTASDHWSRRTWLCTVD